MKTEIKLEKEQTKVCVSVGELIRVLEGLSGNTDTDPRWLAAVSLRQVADWKSRSIVCSANAIVREK